MDQERNTLWREAQQPCKQWLDRKEEYDRLLREVYPLRHNELVELPSSEDLVQETETARKQESDAHSKLPNERNSSGSLLLAAKSEISWIGLAHCPPSITHFRLMGSLPLERQ